MKKFFKQAGKILTGIVLICVFIAVIVLLVMGLYWLGSLLEDAFKK